MTADRPTPYERVAGEPQRRSPRPEHLAWHAGRTLDPSTAVRFEGQQLQSTVYSGTRLLIRPIDELDAIIDALREAADEHQLDIDVNDLDERLVEIARQAGIGPDEPQPLILRVELLPRWNAGPVSPPDAWPVLQSYRRRFAADDRQRAAVQLDHLLTSHAGAPDTEPPAAEHGGITGNPYWQAAGIAGNPYWQAAGATANPYWQAAAANANPYWQAAGTSGNPYWQAADTTATPYWQAASELASYAAPGWGGRTPLAFVGPDPVRCPDEWMEDRRRPVVALLDTGVGDHRWLPDEVVDRKPMCDTLPIGITDPLTNPENPGVSTNPLIGALDVTAGHGTFIAGLIRQTCPDAKILAIRVIQGDGVVSEADLLEALNMLWLRQKLAELHDEPENLIDIVSMSLGYYHEEITDVEFDPFLLAPLRALARLGVAIVTSAGNDATSKPMYPAAFAPWPEGLIKEADPAEVPISAVGALNPDLTVALFSNAGPWVRSYRPGVSLLSTLPSFDASHSPSVELKQGGVIRATVDPDDFRSGFGLWSGTSFAAPILVGEIAQFLNTKEKLPPDSVDPTEAVRRCWAALRTLVPALRRAGEPDPTDPGAGGPPEDAPERPWTGAATPTEGEAQE